MTIEISTAIIISVVSVAFSIFFGLKNNKRSDTKDIEERVRQNTKINMKLDNISSLSEDIKSEISHMKDKLDSHNGRIIKLEDGVKSAHHRIDALEKRMNGGEE